MFVFTNVFYSSIRKDYLFIAVDTNIFSTVKMFSISQIYTFLKFVVLDCLFLTTN